MKQRDPILEKVASLKPNNVLDVGCGCGSFTAELSPYCGKIKAIDFSKGLIDRCKKQSQKPNITYLCMDAREILFSDNSFDLVLERESLHHVSVWEKALDEMIRVSSEYVLIEEPIDDPRNEAKRNTIRAQQLFLEVQNEVGYAHHRHIPKESLTRYFKRRNIPIETRIIKSDLLLDFDECFSSFGFFAEKSRRKKYWTERLETLRKELGCKKLCEEDVFFICAFKR